MSEKNNRSFNEQAFLIYHWFNKNKEKLYTENSSFGSRINNKKLNNAGTIHKIVGNYTVADFVPKLMSNSKLNLYRDFLDLETKKISALVPYVKLYKVDGKSNVPFYFPVSAEKTDMYSLLRPGSSLGGVGIKTFSMNFQGQDPFMRDKNIVCDLSIALDSIESLFKPPPPGFAPLAELITISRNKYVPLKEGMSKQVTSQQLNRATAHEIAADVGYSIDDTSGLFTMEERSAIKNTNLFLRLTLTDHSIDVRPDGTATINAKYIGRVSGMLQNAAYNALLQSPDFLALSAIMSDDNEVISRLTDEEKKKELQQKMKSKIRDNTSSRLRALFEYLDGDLKTEDERKESRIKSIRINSQDIKEYTDYVSGEAELRAVRQAMDAAPGDSTTSPDGEDLDQKAAGDKNRNRTLDYYTGDGITFHYIYMGDLVESFMYNTKRNLDAGIKAIGADQRLTSKAKKARKKPLLQALNDLKTFKVLFGSIVFPLSDNKSVAVNLADVPISIALVQKYFFERIQQTYSVKYTLNNFLEDLTARIYPMLLSDHLYRDAPNMSVKGAVKTMMLSGEKSSVFRNTDVNIKRLPDFLKRRNSLRRKKDDIDYMVIYTERSPDDSIGLSGNTRQDAKKGIYHLNLSKDRGMLKGISFSQVNQRYRKEALMLESVSLYDELKMPYNAQITMFGNNMFLPGSILYINPSSIGFGDPRNERSASARLGIGGYYIVTNVTTSYSNGTLSTNLTAIFNSWPDSDKGLSPMNRLFADSGIFDEAVDKYNRRTRG